MVKPAVARVQEERMAALRVLLPRFRERMRLYDGAAEFPTANFDDLKDAGFFEDVEPARA